MRVFPGVCLFICARQSYMYSSGHFNICISILLLQRRNAKQAPRLIERKSRIGNRYCGNSAKPMVSNRVMLHGPRPQRNRQRPRLEAAKWIIGFVQKVFVEPAGSLVVGAAAPLTVIASSTHAGTSCLVVLHIVIAKGIINESFHAYSSHRIEEVLAGGGTRFRGPSACHGTVGVVD